MSWLTIIWSMNAAVCLTLAVINFFIWLSARAKWGHLLFSIAAAATATVAGFELSAMHAQSAEEFSTILRWAHVPFCVLIVAIVWFARIYLRAGRPWLAWTITAVRLFALIPNFLAAYNLNYKTVSGVERFSVLGEEITTIVGTLNPWVVVGRASSLLLLIFLVDASLTVWKRGERRRALFLGGSLIFCILMAAGDVLLEEMHLIHMPYMVSFSFIGLVFFMAYDLSRDVLRASYLVNELRESEERLSLAADAAKLGIWVRDFARDEIWVSDHWRHLFGFASMERIVFENILERMHPEDRDVFHQNFTKAVAGSGSYETEYRLLLPDGTKRWIASRGHVEFNDGGKPRLLRGISIDITTRKQSEMEVLLQRNELTHLSRVTMLGELSGSMAHELNQPLASILYNAEAALALLEQKPPDLGEVRETLKDILVEDVRAGEVIRRLRLLLIKGELQRQALDLNEVIREVLKIVRADLVSRAVTLQVELASGLRPVDADRIQLQQVLLNLVMNACDTMAHDPENDRRLIIRSGRSAGDSLWVSVTDHGTGIAPENLEKVFDPFFTTKTHGMGLGLSVCRTIISAHHGKLWAANNDDRGATFHFSLPGNGKVA